MAKYTYSANGIESYLSDMHMAAWKLSGSEDIANANTHAVIRYVVTERASVDFVKSMLTHRPSTIAKICLAGGSCDDIVNRVKAYLKVA